MKNNTDMGIYNSLHIISMILRYFKTDKKNWIKSIIRLKKHDENDVFFLYYYSYNVKYIKHCAFLSLQFDSLSVFLTISEC